MPRIDPSTMTTMTDTDRLYFRQLLSGRDFAVDDPMAQQMANFVYLVGDRSTGEAVVIDPAYSPQDLVDVAAADDMRLVGALGTHYHADHIGGRAMGFEIAGMVEMLEIEDMTLHVQTDEAEWVKKTSGLGDGNLTLHDPGDTLAVGEVEIRFVHTPGHTPGSQCFLVDGALVSGDTLFLDGCGRTDLPGGNQAQLFQSLAMLAQLPDETVLFPGHKYSIASFATMEATKASNFIYQQLLDL